MAVKNNFWNRLTGKYAAHQASQAQDAGYNRAIDAQNNALNQGLAAQQAATQQGVGFAQDYQRQQMDLLNPSIQMGQGAMNQMGAFSGLGGIEAQQAAIGGMENDPTFQAMARQQEEAMLQNASATGGLRGGNTQAALAQFRPQMLQEQINQRMANLGGLAGMGMNSMNQASAGMMNTGQLGAGMYGNMGQSALGAHQNTGNNLSNLYSGQGEAQGAGHLSQYQTGKSFFTDIIGMGTNLINPIGNLFPRKKT